METSPLLYLDRADPLKGPFFLQAAVCRHEGELHQTSSVSRPQSPLYSMKTEPDEHSEYDFGSRDSSAEVSVKEEFAFPLSPSSSVSLPTTPLTTWPYSTLLTPQSLVAPSQLVLTDIVVKRPPPSPASSTAEPAPKKAKRKARTEEEKEARAYERTMRNRRAAQESRDRKKRQFEALEEENRRLQDENDEMKRRIKELETQQFNLVIDPIPYPALNTPTDEDDEASTEPVIKTEVSTPERFDLAFHPAAMESDPQCLSISLESTICFTTMAHLFCNLLFHIWTIVRLQMLSSTPLSMTTRISLMNERPAYLFLATLNSLNTGSLFAGAENGLCDSSCLQGGKWLGLGRVL